MPMTMLALRGRAAAKSPLEDATDFLMDAKFQVQQMDDLKNEVEELKPKIDAGEEEARRALTRLIDLSNEPNAKWVMESAGVLSSAAELMSRPTETDDIQRLAGSLITRLTDVPVTSEISEEKTGSYGRVHVVVPRPGRVYRPDETIIDLMSGVKPSDLSTGDYLLSSAIDA